MSKKPGDGQRSARSYAAIFRNVHFEAAESKPVHGISIVVPVYRGEHSLPQLVEEIRPLVEGIQTPSGRQMRVVELVLVNDCGPDRSEDVIRQLGAEFSFIHPIWLSRNYGQHAATIAGMSSTGGDWIVTMDEDGQFDPLDIGRMLDVAVDRSAQLVYAIPSNEPPHGTFRNLGSRLAKLIAATLLPNANIGHFTSFRLMLGEVGRGVAAYVGPGVFLDVALAWGFGTVETCSLEFRSEYSRPSGYSLRKLLSHFWQLVISAGPRPLRIVSGAGLLAAFAGVVVAVLLLIERVTGRVTVPGWTSLAIIVLVIGGLTLLALGVIAEYVGAAVGMAMGKPLYLMTKDPSSSPLRREQHADASTPEDSPLSSTSTDE